MVKGKATATLQGRTIAETDEYELVEGNVYFPPSYVTSWHPKTLTDILKFGEDGVYDQD